MSKIRPYTPEEHAPIADCLLRIEDEIGVLLDYLNAERHAVSVRLVSFVLDLNWRLQAVKRRFMDEMQDQHPQVNAHAFYFPHDRKLRRWAKRWTLETGRPPSSR